MRERDGRGSVFARAWCGEGMVLGVGGENGCFVMGCCGEGIVQRVSGEGIVEG